MHTLLCIRDFPYALPTVQFGSLVVAVLESEASIMTVRPEAEDPGIGRQLVREAAKLFPSPEVTRILRHGRPEEVIVDEVSGGDYDLVIIGTPESPSLGDFLLGLTARRLVAHTDVSVMIVRNPSERIERMLITSTGTRRSHPVVAAGAHLAQALGAQTILLHVTAAVPEMYFGLPRMEGGLEDFMRSGTPAAENLKKHMSILGACGVQAHLELRHGLPTEEILRSARKNESDLIVIGGPKPRTIDRLFKDEVALDIVDHAPCPVLVVRGRIGREDRK